MRKKLLSSLLVLTLTSQIGIVSATGNVSEIEKRLENITSSEKNIIATTWINSRTATLLEEAKSIKNTPYSKITPDDRKQKSLILDEVDRFLSDIKNGKYDFSISQSEKTETENTIIGYQKDFVAFIKKSIEDSQGK
jgi:hypothetical protein